ncbi:hypothetical protein [Caldivirga maquilingensis]|uniref:Uncharacterized protein n=1 Tax=Caldivirga maquilingensis (strain ATCC 700844 / DSM 13496 / JCM 10307 / IC-167) TaxID=397948 RepID=A8MDR7_CALMQ|nr:hypothetical protein [Caldivirga maquilingensis]ABW01923.1 hypothetical protein Cmaq_1095 [Caldivirga maquilingensis IC-167]
MIFEVPSYLRLKDSLEGNEPVIVTGLPRSGISTALNWVLNTSDAAGIGKTGFKIMELPKAFNEDAQLSMLLSKLKGQLDQHGERFIVSGRSNVVEFVFSNGGNVRGGRDWFIGIYQGLRSLRRRLLSLSYEWEPVIVDGFRTYMFSFSKEDAVILAEHLGVRRDKDVDAVLEYSSFKSLFRGVYLPGLIVEGTRKILNGEELFEQNERIGESERMFVFSAPLLTSAAEAFAESPVEAASSIAETVGRFITGMGLAWELGVLFASFFGFGSFSEKRFEKELVSVGNAWRTLPEDKREVIASVYDRELKLIPGTSRSVLDDLFLGVSTLRSKVEQAWSYIRQVEVHQTYDTLLSRRDASLELVKIIKQSHTGVQLTSKGRGSEVAELTSLIRNAKEEVRIWRQGFSAVNELIPVFKEFLTRPNTEIKVLLKIDQFSLQNASRLLELARVYPNLELAHFDSSLRGEIYDQLKLRLVTKTPRTPTTIDDPRVPGTDSEFYYAVWLTEDKEWLDFALGLWDYCWSKAVHDVESVISTFRELM